MSIENFVKYQLEKGNKILKKSMNFSFLEMFSFEIMQSKWMISLISSFQKGNKI